MIMMITREVLEEMVQGESFDELIVVVQWALIQSGDPVAKIGECDCEIMQM